MAPRCKHDFSNSLRGKYEICSKCGTRRLRTPNDGSRARDEGIYRVLSNENPRWLDAANNIVLDNFPVGWVGPAEEFQKPVVAAIGPPHTYHVWGGLSMRFRSRKIFEDTGEYAPLEKPSSHARRSPLIRRIK